MGQEFVNYRKVTLTNERLKFSHSVRQVGIGNVPIVVDSVDPEMSKALSTPPSMASNNRRNREFRKFGMELTKHMDMKVSDVLKDIKSHLIQQDAEDMFMRETLVIGLEDGTIQDVNIDVGTLYKRHRNEQDKILYLLVTKETTMYGYIVSIIKYLTSTVKSTWLAVGWISGRR